VPKEVGPGHTVLVAPDTDPSRLAA